MATDKLVDFDHVTDYISRKAAYESLNRIKSYLHQQHSEYSTMMFWEVEDFIETLPAADVVEVVRCKDCKEFQANHHWCGFLKTDIDPDGFCSYGERRSDKNAG